MSTLINGREHFDQTPVAYPIHFNRPEPLHIRIRRMILEQMAESQSYNDYDTAEEADNFDVDEDDQFSSSKYEMEDDFDHMYDSKWSAGGAGGTPPPVKETAKDQNESNDGSESSTNK